MNIELSDKQKSILDDLLSWYKNPINQYVTLGGYAGTGKTTLLGYLNAALHKENKNIKIAYCTFTGKASTVLRKKLLETKSLNSSDYVGTIHKLIYVPVDDGDGRIIDWEKIPVDDFHYDLIIIDEASMVTKEIWTDLLTFGKPILAVGDHGQLPPVSGKFNLMENPMFRLEEIYRQEADNPIIKVSEIARKYGSIPAIDFGPTVKKFRKTDEDLAETIGDMLASYDKNMLVLVGYNNTRLKLNTEIRRILEFETRTPDVNDRVICLRNNRNEGIYNGMTGTILSIHKEDINGVKFYDAEIELDGDDSFFGRMSIEQFNNALPVVSPSPDINLFDFGYAMTVHKAQGSQADKVVLFEERFAQMDDDTWRRWLYTAVTRAVSELYIIG